MKPYASLYFCIAVCALSATHAAGQVYTRILGDGEPLWTYVPFEMDEDVIYYAQPVVDFAAVLADDLRKARPLSRAAVKVAKDYKVKDGVWSQAGDYYVWQIGFSAPTASSLNFHLRDLILPEGAELYVLSRDGRMVHGPVTAAVVYDGVYATDLIEATEVKIVARVPVVAYKKFSIRVAAVNQGIAEQERKAFRNPGDLEPRGWGDAEDCQLDVRCPVGAGWEAERDAVVKLIVNGEDHCSGALINDQCQDFRPFVLTAFHCLDVIVDDGVLSTAERDVSLWLFRFNYESLAPTCPGNTAGNEGIYLTYSGAAFRSARAQTDFALLELNGSIMNQPNLAMAGWDRSGIAPNATTVIHHPNGDAKKISFDFDQATAQTIFINNTNVSVWSVQLDLGSTEGGSSGSPYFSQNHRITGQHASVQSGFPECDLTPMRRAGRFDLSWTGGGTNDSRLSNWLGGASPPLTMNTLRVPWVSPSNAGGALHYVCSTNKTFTLQNSVAGTTVAWSVTNPNLFAASSGALRSGTGATAVLRAASASTTGSAVLTFTITRNCNGVTSQSTLQRQIWVGRPGTPVTSPSGQTLVEIGVSEYHTVYLNSAPGADPAAATWSATGAVSKVEPSGPGPYGTYEGMYAGTGHWQTTTSNDCGTRVYSGQYKVVSGSGTCHPCPRVGIQNPVRDVLTLTIAPLDVEDDGSIAGGKRAPTQVEVVDQSGRAILRFDFNGSSTIQDVSMINSGLYFAKVIGDFGEETVKVVIVR